MIKQIYKLCQLKYKKIWIYNWNVINKQFYCIPLEKKDNSSSSCTVVNNPIAVNLSKHLEKKYNHLIIISQNLKLTEERLLSLNTNTFPNLKLVKPVNNDTGYLIMKELTAKNIIKQKNTGKVILVYCTNAKDLYTFLKYNYNYFGIEAMSNYRNPIQAYFNHKRRELTHFESRGVFEINCDNKNHEAEEEITFVNSNLDDINFPPYKITAFDIETARIDCNDIFPLGDTLYDCVCSVAWQTVTVKNVLSPSVYEDVETVVLVFIPSRFINDVKSKVDDDNNNNKGHHHHHNLKIVYFSSEKELLCEFLKYLMYPDAIFITGWNIMNFDYKYLLKRLIYHQIVPSYLLSSLYKICALQDSKVCDIAPPWKLSVDTMLSRIRFFPRTLPINPPSNSLDTTAKMLLSNDDDDDDKENHTSKIKIDIRNINRIYAMMIMMEGNESKEEEIYQYLKDLIIYNIRDVELVTKLNGVLNVIQILVPLSTLADLNPGDCIHYNTSKVGITFMKNQFESIIMAPIDYNLVTSKRQSDVGLFDKSSNSSSSRRNDDDDDDDDDDDEDERIKGKKGTYKGATVLEPLMGVYCSGNNNNNNTLLGSVDFASLYPNIMLSYGIIRGFVTRVTSRKYVQNEKEYASNFVSLVTPDDSKHIYLSCKDKETVKNCPISYLCRKLIEKRKLNKKKVPTLANALKILVNSIYGLFGVAGSPLYSKIVAIMITSYGRHHLLRAKNYFEKKFDNLTVLYGDTDSLFIKCVNPVQSLYEMVDQFNQYMVKEQALESIQLSVDGVFECIILIRKKLYMAKMKDKSYKLSGFPQRMQPHIFKHMVASLYGILDLMLSYNDDKPQRNAAVFKFYKEEIFNKCVEQNESINYHSLSIKVNPIKSYKSKHSKQYYLANLYERHYGIPINSSVYVSVCQVIPLVKNMCKKKSLTLCLADCFNDKLQSLNKAAFITEFFCKTFDPILKVVIINDNNDDREVMFEKNSLKKMSENYIENIQKITLKKYIQEKYRIFDFSDCKYQGGNRKISFMESWPKFFNDYFLNEDMRSKNGKIIWIKEEKEEKEEEKEDDDDHRENGGDVKKRKNPFATESENKKIKNVIQHDIFLSLTLYDADSHYNNHHHNNDNNISEACLTQSNVKDLKFKNVKSVNNFLNKFFKDVGGKHDSIKKRLYLKIENEIHSLRDILNFWAFIYDKNFTPMDLDNLHTDCCKNFLVILPFIAIRSVNDHYEFIYH